MFGLRTLDTKHFIPELENLVGGDLGNLDSVTLMGTSFFISRIRILKVFIP